MTKNMDRSETTINTIRSKFDIFYLFLKFWITRMERIMRAM